MHPQNNSQQAGQAQTTPVKSGRDSPLLLTRAEVLMIMKLMNGKRLIGTDYHEESLSREEEERATDALLAKGVLLRKEDEIELSSPYIELFQTVFFPQNALIAVRDLPDLGKQLLIYLHRQGDQAVLHSMPEAGKHRFQLLKTPEEVRGMLLEWFPLARYVSSQAAFRLTEEQFEKLRISAGKNDYEQSMAILAHQKGDDAEKKHLIGALAGRVFSGSFALLKIVNGDEAVDADSMAVFAGSSTAWAVVLDESTEDGQAFLKVMRIGKNFENLLDAMIQKF